MSGVGHQEVRDGGVGRVDRLLGLLDDLLLDRGVDVEAVDDELAFAKSFCLTNRGDHKLPFTRRQSDARLADFAQFLQPSLLLRHR